MGIISSLSISGSGLTACRVQMDVIANNIANANTTRTPEGGPYRRQEVILEAAGPTPRPLTFAALLSRSFATRGAGRGKSPRYGETGEGLPSAGGVVVRGIISNPSPPKLVYDPSHPDANAQGYVAFPNVEVIKEMVDMIVATRAYEANVQAINSAKSMVTSALEIGRG